MENKENKEKDSVQHNLINVNIELMKDLYVYCKERENDRDNIHVIEFLSNMQAQLVKLKNQMQKAKKKEFGIIDTRQSCFKYWY